MKLLPARVMLGRAQATGRLQPGGPIAETTSGTFSMALAMLAAVRGFELTLVSAARLIDDTLRRRLEYLGTTVHVIDDPDGSGARSEARSVGNEVVRTGRSRWSS